MTQFRKRRYTKIYENFFKKKKKGIEGTKNSGGGGNKNIGYHNNLRSSKSEFESPKKLKKKVIFNICTNLMWRNTNYFCFLNGQTHLKICIILLVEIF